MSEDPKSVSAPSPDRPAGDPPDRRGSRRTMPLRPRRTGAAQRGAVEQVKRWTRVRFGLPADAAVLVSEVAVSLPGCPPIETVVAFWTGAERRHHFKVFKPVGDVVEEDLPPSWMKDALIESDIFGCECC
jgi:hypothetical protein